MDPCWLFEYDSLHTSNMGASKFRKWKAQPVVFWATGGRSSIFSSYLGYSGYNFTRHIGDCVIVAFMSSGFCSIMRSRKWLEKKMGWKISPWLERYNASMELAIPQDGSRRCFLLYDVDICAFFHKCRIFDGACSRLD